MVDDKVLSEAYWSTWGLVLGDLFMLGVGLVMVHLLSKKLRLGKRLWIPSLIAVVVLVVFFAPQNAILLRDGFGLIAKGKNYLVSETCILKDIGGSPRFKDERILECNGQPEFRTLVVHRERLLKVETQYVGKPLEVIVLPVSGRVIGITLPDIK